MSKDNKAPGRELATREDSPDMMQIIEHARNRGMPISTLFLAHPGLRQSAMEMAQAMANARGMIGPHLVGQTAACFAIMTKSLQWGLDAFEVAQATYATPGGSIGYFGRLVHAVMDSHPRVDRMMFEDIGDWSRLHGKFQKKAGKKTDANGNPIFYMAEAWTPADEVGLGVRVWAKFKDGTEGEKLEVWLAECNPRNATTWPTRPRLQIRNVAIRAYANMIDPSLFMGTRFDDTDPDFGQHYGPENAKDVTPREEADAGERKSRLDQFAERHGKEPDRAETGADPDATAGASQALQDEREPETQDDAGAGEIGDPGQSAEPQGPFLITNLKGDDFEHPTFDDWLADWSAWTAKLREKGRLDLVEKMAAANARHFVAIGGEAEQVSGQLSRLADEMKARGHE